MSRFYGDKRIENKIETEDRVELIFKDGSSVRLPRKMYEVSVTRDATYLTNLWDRQLSPVVKEMLQTMLDWDINMEQLDYLFNLLKSSLEYNNKKANEKLWGKPLKERTMSDIDKVLQDGNTGN